MTEASPPAPDAAHKGVPQTGATPAQGTPAPSGSAGEYDPRSFGAGVSKAKAEAAKELAEAREKLARFEDATKTAEQILAERNTLLEQVESFKKREAARLEAVKADVAKRMKDWPEDAVLLVGADSVSDADELRARVDRVAALVSRSAAPSVPGGYVAPAAGPAVDLAEWQQARRRGVASEMSAAMNRLVAKHGRALVDSAMQAQGR